MPFTPTAPPADMLIRSHPGPSGWQLTDGGDGSGPLLASSVFATACASALGLASALSTASRWAAAAVAVLAATAALAEPTAYDAVDGEKNGPVSRSQPGLSHPVAAGPTKVGETVPRLDDVTVEWFEWTAGAARTVGAESIPNGRPSPNTTAKSG